MFSFGNDIGIDLGTATVLIYMKGKGIVLREPSCVAVNQDTGRIMAVGFEAKNMVGRTPGNVVSVRPLRDGVIADYSMTEAMLRYFMKKVNRGIHRYFRSRVMICVPSASVTTQRKRAPSHFFSTSFRLRVGPVKPGRSTHFSCLGSHTCH